jgi:MFS family permease
MITYREYSKFLMRKQDSWTALTSALLTGLIGLLADRFGRKPFLVMVPWLAAGASVAFAFSRTAGVLFVCAALGSFGRGSGAGSGTIGPYQPAEQAFLADAVPARHRNSLFGRIAFASSTQPDTCRLSL